MSSSNVYIGAAQAGRSSQGGIFRWTPGNGGVEKLTNGLPDNVQVQAVTLHPSDPNVVYSGADKVF